MRDKGHPGPRSLLFEFALYRLPDAMSPDAQTILARLEAYSPDDPTSAFPFSAKLAKESGWTREFALRVVTEYKRFAFLAMTADHVVAPSDQVDQAWHLHLTYTRTYWEEFCGVVLGRPLHHEPSRGGRPEDGKYRDLYVRTLESYRKVFGEEPPADIWPPVEIRFGEDTRFVRVNRARHWIIRKPQRLLQSLRLIPMAAPILALAGCGSAVVATINPFDFRGPEFLQFFCAFTVLMSAISAGLRWWLRAPSASESNIRDVALTPYEAAMLAGGRERVVAAALAILIRREEVALRSHLDSPTDIEAIKAPSDTAHPLEQLVWNEVQSVGPITMGSLVANLGREVAPLTLSLESRELLVDAETSRRARLVPLAVMAIVPLVGLLKTVIGLSRNKPVGFLLVGTVATTVLALVVFMRRVYRSRAGDAVLRRLRREHPDLQVPSPTLHAMTSETGVALPMAVALFGSGALVNAGLGTLETAMQRSMSSGLGSSASGCGTSGCGSGCGGGGGCGGGCGGCGGGS